ncbi:MAG: hypothetical protein HWN81_13440 [Candidatus Lokiarchaeota archaeon]|nr:hypothetical protein [Candidatus Lokiarchaeota archaeon]
MKANVPTRKKIKLNWFKSNCALSIERKIAIEYNTNSVTYNKITWDVLVKYVLTKEGAPKEIPANSPMTLYKGGLPFLFLSTSTTIGNKIISEELIDSDIVVDDDIVNINEGEDKVTYEDARDPKEHIEVRTRLDKITRKITIENKLENEIELELNFKQTKDVSFIKSLPEPSKIEEPNYKYAIKIPSEQKSSVILDLQAKIVKRVTRIKPEYLKLEENRLNQFKGK